MTNKMEQRRTKNPDPGQIKKDSGISSSASRSNAKYWESKLRRRMRKDSAGNMVQSADYNVRLCHQNQQRFISLQTANKALAAQRARDAYLLLKSSGWEALWERYKIRQSGNEAMTCDCTVGEFFGRIQTKSSIKPQTFVYYRRAFCQILADVFNIQSGPEKFDYVHGGAKKRLDRILKIKLSCVSKDKIESWKNETLQKKVKMNQSHRSSICATINKVLRNAKALFAKKLLAAIGFDGAFTSPFGGIEFLPEGSHRYTSMFDPKTIVQAAESELRNSLPEAFKIFILALCAGLRRNEIDKLLWRQVNFERRSISVQQTEYFSPKTKESCSDIYLDDAVVGILKGLKTSATGQFVIESDINPRPNAHYQHYRCDRIHKQLIAWLRTHGINSNNPLHTLRKEYGSEICRQFGLYEASRALRHSSYGITESFYVDRKVGITPKFF
jgi:integrase